MAKANVATDAHSLREAIRVLNSLPLSVTGVVLKFGADRFTLYRDSDDAWYLAEVE